MALNQLFAFQYILRSSGVREEFSASLGRRPRAMAAPQQKARPRAAAVNRGRREEEEEPAPAQRGIRGNPMPQRPLQEETWKPEISTPLLFSRLTRTPPVWSNG